MQSEAHVEVEIPCTNKGDRDPGLLVDESGTACDPRFTISAKRCALMTAEHGTRKTIAPTNTPTPAKTRVSQAPIRPDRTQLGLVSADDQHLA